MHTTPINIGFCIAYDWKYLKISLPIIYAHATEICLSLDKNRVSWSGNRFEFDESAFQQFIQSNDPDGKITVLEEDFFQDASNPMRNEVNQRQRMAESFSTKGWVFQLDVDEYFTHFDAAIRAVQQIPFQTEKALNLCFRFHTLFKYNEDGLFFIHPNNEWMAIATNIPSYVYGRKNGAQNRYFPQLIIHQSYGRTKEEIADKLKNWGHRNDFDGQEFLQRWENLNSSNFTDYVHFHPIDPNCWKRLNFEPNCNIESYIESFEEQTSVGLKTKFELFCLNSKIICKLVQLTGIKPWMFP
jgi:hypothetical protein